jgi:glutamyl-tRNA reductase
MDDSTMTSVPGTACTSDMARAMQSLHQISARPKDHELQRLFNKLPELGDEAQREIRQSFDRLTDSLFRPPLDSIRAEARAGTSGELFSALMRLFRCQLP